MPVVLYPRACPAPEAPPLATLNPGNPLEEACNVRALLERDDTLRMYIIGLRDTIHCYEIQTVPSGKAVQERKQ